MKNHLKFKKKQACQTAHIAKTILIRHLYYDQLMHLLTNIVAFKKFQQLNMQNIYTIIQGLAQRYSPRSADQVKGL